MLITAEKCYGPGKRERAHASHARRNNEGESLQHANPSHPRPHAAAPPQPGEYLLSAAASAALQHLAALAPTLKEAELRVLIHLTGAALASGRTDVRASSRDIADDCKCSRRNVQHALDGLNERGLIATRQGHATKAAAYCLRFLDVTQMGGAATTPPLPQGGATPTPQVALFRLHPGAESAPPPTDSTPLPAAPSALDINPDRRELLDRVLSAKSKDQPRDLLQLFAETVNVYAERLGRHYTHRPDVECCAQLIAACGTKDGLNSLIIEMSRLRKQPGESPMWWVTVALQRFHGIDAKVTAARRAELKAANRPKLERIADPRAHAADVEAIKRDLEKIAEMKRF